MLVDFEALVYAAQEWLAEYPEGDPDKPYMPARVREAITATQQWEQALDKARVLLEHGDV